MTRDPTDRVWSDYQYFSAFQRKDYAKCWWRAGGASTLHFHEHMEQEVRFVERCIADRWASKECARRLCKDLNAAPFSACPPGRLVTGLYEAHFAEWRRQFGPGCDGRSRFHEVRLEDLAARPRETMRDVAAFLGLEHGDAILADLAHAGKTNPEEHEGRLKVEGLIPRLGPMLNRTRELLDRFYARHGNSTLPRQIKCI